MIHQVYLAGLVGGASTSIILEIKAMADGESNFCGYDSDGEVGPFYNAVSEELGIQDEAIFDHEPPPPAPLSPSRVIPENPR